MTLAEIIKSKVDELYETYNSLNQEKDKNNIESLKNEINKLNTLISLLSKEFKNLKDLNYQDISNYISLKEQDLKNVQLVLKAKYDANFMNLDDKDQEIKANTISHEKEEYDDPLYNEIVEFVITTGKASSSLLQRKFKLGYNRAARIVDLLEERGIIGPQNGSKPREVLIKLENNQNNEPSDEE